VLRHPQALTLDPRDRHNGDDGIGVSLGTACVLGLRRLRQTDAPTTAYLLVGDRCALDCAFCAQARTSNAHSHLLSRVTWPAYEVAPTLQAVAESYAHGAIRRCCFQVTCFRGHVERTALLTRQLTELCAVPISVSIALSRLQEVELLLNSGAQRVTLAMDAASRRVFRSAKSGSWEIRLRLLRQAAERFPGRLGTHLIVGLGETEREMVMLLQDTIDRGISVGLFSFTPVDGTALAHRAAPALGSYRCIQAARFLLATGVRRLEDLEFSAAGQLCSFGTDARELEEWLGDGTAFRTAGCTGCNRPFYNERALGPMYNYARPLAAWEVQMAIRDVLDRVQGSATPGGGRCDRVDPTAPWAPDPG